MHKTATPPTTVGTINLLSARVNNIRIENNLIRNLDNPILGNDATNKDYVDSSVVNPANPDTSVQFNNSGSFGGSGDLVWDIGTSTLIITGDASVSGAISIPLAPASSTDAANKSYVDSVFTPAGPAQAVQFNSDPSGTFSGDSDFSWNNVGKELTVTGTIFATSYQTLSDIGLKSNILSIDEPLKILNKLEGFSYNLNGAKERTYGVMAQSLKEHEDLKDLVKPFGNFQTVDYQQMIPMLVEGLKKISQENKQLKEEIQKIKSLIS